MLEIQTPPDCGISAREVTAHDCGHFDSLGFSKARFTDADRIYLTLAQLGPLRPIQLVGKTGVEMQRVCNVLYNSPKYERLASGKYRIREGY